MIRTIKVRQRRERMMGGAILDQKARESFSNKVTFAKGPGSWQKVNIGYL